MKILHCVVFGLLVIGGLNWLLVGAAGTDVGQLLFGSMDAVVSRIIYVLVGIAAIVSVVTHKSSCSACCGAACENKNETPAAV